MAAVAQVIPSATYNPYLEENNQLGSNGTAYYQGQANYAASIQPVSLLLFVEDFQLSFAVTISSLCANWTT